jgi:cardiolipin synthase
MSSLPNALTVARIALVPLFCAAFFLPGEAGRWIVFMLFCLAGATDALDGMIAASTAWKARSGGCWTRSPTS